jgi:PmbA protein
MINFNLADMMHNITALSKEVLCDGAMVVPYIEVSHVLISGK